jgi:pimeloyl-ACP methyl ester carboxylesterase
MADAGPAGGTPVMLVHGFPRTGGNGANSSDRWPPTAIACCARICVVPAELGAIRSLPQDRHGRDLAAVLDRLGVGPVTLVAHDWGGPVAFI